MVATAEQIALMEVRGLRSLSAHLDWFPRVFVSALDEIDRETLLRLWKKCPSRHGRGACAGEIHGFVMTTVVFAIVTVVVMVMAGCDILGRDGATCRVQFSFSFTSTYLASTTLPPHWGQRQRVARRDSRPNSPRFIWVW
jgi:hypothetical protein